MAYWIITGTSRGLGLAMAKQLLDTGHHIVGIARSEQKELERYELFNAITWDLSQADGLEGRMTRILKALAPPPYANLFLVHNAGVVGPIEHLESVNADALAKGLHVNLLAPMVLSSEFIQYLKAHEGIKRIVHISSGAANTPYDGWSSYCCSKAGLDMLTKCIATEQGELEHPVEVLSVAPGILDTKMQEEIRDANPDAFSNLERFKALYTTGSLTSPEVAAKKIIHLILNGDFVSGDILDIRQ